MRAANGGGAEPDTGDGNAHHREALTMPKRGGKTQLLARLQIPYRYNPIAGIPPLQRTGYYYLPSGWQNTTLPVMVLFHGLEGFGVSILNSGSQGTYQVRGRLLRTWRRNATHY